MRQEGKQYKPTYTMGNPLQTVALILEDVSMYIPGNPRGIVSGLGHIIQDFNHKWLDISQLSRLGFGAK